MRAPKRNDSSSDDMIIPDEEETKNANLLSECDNLFVPPVAPLFKPPNHAVAGNEAMHKLASVNIDVKIDSKPQRDGYHVNLNWIESEDEDEE